MSYSECHRILPSTWRSSLTEGVISLFSQLSAHAVCVVAAFLNLVIGGVSFAIGHDFWSTLLLGTTIYLTSVALRWLWSGDAHLPSFAMGALGLGIGVLIASGIDAAQTQSHRRELGAWYANLSTAERQNVREKVHNWLERQGRLQREALSSAAELIGYERAEDYVVLNYCSPANKELTAIWKDAGAPSDRDH